MIPTAAGFIFHECAEENSMRTELEIWAMDYRDELTRLSRLAQKVTAEIKWLQLRQWAIFDRHSKELK
jgi:hypothetical protein